MEPEVRIPAESVERGHEQRDLGAGWLAMSLVALALLVLVSALGIVAFQGLLESRAVRSDPERSPMVETDVQPPQPRLESTPGEVLDRLRILERVQLERYGWVDRPAGLARVPVERAMELLVEHGLEAVAPAPSGTEEGS